MMARELKRQLDLLFENVRKLNKRIDGCNATNHSRAAEFRTRLEDLENKRAEVDPFTNPKVLP